MSSVQGISFPFNFKVPMIVSDQSERQRESKCTYRSALCQATWQLAPSTKLGLSVGSFFALRASCQRRFIANVAKNNALRRSKGRASQCLWMRVHHGAWNKRAIIIDTTIYVYEVKKRPTQDEIDQQHIRTQISAVCGYSSKSIKFFDMFSIINFSASSSMKVVTKLARFSAGFPSSYSSAELSRW